MEIKQMKQEGLLPSLNLKDSFLPLDCDISDPLRTRVFLSLVYREDFQSQASTQCPDICALFRETRLVVSYFSLILAFQGSTFSLASIMLGSPLVHFMVYSLVTGTSPRLSLVVP